MKFKIDENLPDDTAQLLRTAGYEADTVRDQGLGGAADEAVADTVRTEGRVLLTLDHDFCDIRTYPPVIYAGIISLALEAARQGFRAEGIEAPDSCATEAAARGATMDRRKRPDPNPQGLTVAPQAGVHNERCHC